MIDIRPATGDGILELHMSGRITAADYDDVITPALDDALARHDRIRLLARIGPEFEGYTAGAAWADTRLGLRHWSGFERVAVVTDRAELGGELVAFLVSDRAAYITGQVIGISGGLG